MSRYRDEREDEYFGGRMRDRDFEERSERERADFDQPPPPGYYGDAEAPRRAPREYDDRGYYRTRDDAERDYGQPPRRPERDDYARDYEGRGRRGESGERRPADPDERRAAYDARGRGDYDERRGYDDDDRRPPRERDYGEREGRSLWEEGREYFRRRGRGRRGGVTARSHLRCRDIMTRDVTVATRDTTLEAVARMMRDEDTGVIPVVDRAGAPVRAGASVAPPPPTPPKPEAGGIAAAVAAADRIPTPLPPEPVGESPEARRINADIHGNGRLVGLITDRDIAVRAVAEGRDTRTTRAEEIMTSDVHTAHPNDRVIEAIRKMGDKQVRRIPIVDREGVLRGIISMADVALETDDDRELAEALEEISSGSSFWSKIFG